MLARVRSSPTGLEDVLGRINYDVSRNYTGTDSADAFAGGRFSDVFTGGAGRDTFMIHSNSGSDRVLDFQQGQDLVAVQADVAGSVESLLAGATYADGNAVVHVGANSLTLVGVASLQASDFLLI